MKIIKKISYMIVSSTTLAFGFAGAASAHVTVKPSDVQTSAYQIFSVSVPAESNYPTISVKLEIPEDITSVRPTVKPGWTILTEKQGEGDDAVITTITWTGGKIDAGYRDDFTFSAKTSDHPMDLEWKVYQTYQDGTVVSWDQSTGDATDVPGATSGPFSTTKVANDSDQTIALKNADSKAVGAQATADKALYAGIGGIILAVVVGLVMIVRKPKANEQL